jgi:hypothetical protein
VAAWSGNAVSFFLQVHYGVPEGSYATEPDGAPRIREFREMITALHKQVSEGVATMETRREFTCACTS